MKENDHNDSVTGWPDASSRILVVEDDEGLSRLIEKSLIKIGANVDVVNNGTEAIARIVADPPLVTLLDYKLPDMSAREIVEILKNRKIDFPFIVMTGHGDENLAVEMMKAGARDYIVKRGEFFELLPSIIKWVFRELQSEEKLARANNALRESEKKYRTIVDNALVGIYRTNIGGDILYANKAMTDMFGHESLEEMMSKSFWQIFKNRVVRKSLINSLKESGSVDEFECECVTKNGEDIDVLLTATMYDNIISGIMVNITARKKMEKLLIQSEKLRAMGVMAAGIAHDFNNVLAIINGYSELLAHSSDGNEEMIKGLKAITRAVDDGAETVRRLSEFTRRETSMSKYISVNLVDLITQSIDFAKPKWKDVAHAGGKTYEMDVEGLSPVQNVLGNPAELREIIINIINNAIDAMPDGGCITFRTWESGDSVFMNIADRGCGMSKEVQEKIFDPFYTTKGIEGSGLGMSVSYGIIVKHGGKIEVTSKIGKGTVFTIELPVATKKVLPDSSQEPAINIKHNKYRILVADDVKEISGILHMFLTRQGYNVDKVDSGAEAVKQLQKECYDLIICDLGMPEVSGWDVIRAVESLDKRPKIGLITGWADMLDSLKKDDMGVDFVISKPIKYQKLSTIVKEVLLDESQDAVDNSRFIP